MRKIVYSLPALLLVMWALPAFGEHSIDVIKASAAGNHYQAMLAYSKLPQRQRDWRAELAAAQSAMALGMVAKADELFSDLLQNPLLPKSEVPQVHLWRGILAFQERQYSVALLHARRATDLSENAKPAPHAELLMGDIYQAKKEPSAALQHYQAALALADPQQAAELHFRIAKANLEIGQLDAAKQSFEQVPLAHPRTPEAIKGLAELALRSNKPEHAVFWLQRGRNDYPDQFVGSWYDYSLLQASSQSEQWIDFESTWREAVERYPASDPWFTLLESLYEIGLWKRSQQDQEMK